MHNRLTQDKLKRSLHITEQINHGKINTILVSPDAAKAFDMVGWKYLCEVMEKSDFCKNFIQCLTSLYPSLTVRMKIYGNLSVTIQLQ